MKPGENRQTFWRKTIHIQGLILLAVQLTGCEQNYGLVRLPGPAMIQFQIPSASSSRSYETIDRQDLGRQPFGSTSRTAVYLYNKGDLPATSLALSMESSSPGMNYTLENHCKDQLGSKEAPCEVDILFSPSTLGAIPALLKVSYLNGKGGSSTVSIPITAAASNLALLKFEESNLDAGLDTIGYSRSVTYNVIYNGSLLGAAGLAILPAQGVQISNPTHSTFTLDPTGTTCGDVVRQNCMIKLKFTPTQVGVIPADFGLGYFNGAESHRLPAHVQGTATPATVLGSLSATTTDFGNVVANPAAPKVLSIPVTFSGSVPVDHVVITGPANAAFTLSSDTALTTCQNGTINGNCRLSVSFNPGDYAQYSDQITITYQSNTQPSNSPLTLALKGKGVHPANVQLAASLVDFGNDPAHKSITRTVALTNTGEVAVSSLTSPLITSTLGATSAFTPTFDASCSTLAPGASCNLSVRFNPATADSFDSQISFTYLDGKSTQSSGVEVKGTGTSPFLLELKSSLSNLNSRSLIDFGNILIGGPSLPSTTVRLGVYGTTPLSTASQLSSTPSSLSSPFAFPGGNFPGGGSCIAPLNPNSISECTFSTSMTTNALPANVAVTQDFTLNYQGDGGNGSGSLPFTVKATPRNPPVLSFQNAPTGFTTQSVGKAATLQFQIANNSPYFATSYRSASISPAGSPFSISSNGCTGGVGANGTCTIQVTMNPTASGTFNGSLSLVYSDQIQDQTITASLQGSGSSDVTLVADRSSVSFGNAYVGDPAATATINLTYYGLNSWTPAFTVSPPFSLDASACGSPASCALRISFAPTAPGNYSQTFDLTYSPGLSVPSKLTFSLSGAGFSRAPNLVASGLSFPKTLVGKSYDQMLTLTNNGTTTANALTLPTPTGVFSLNAGNPGTCVANQDLASGRSCTLGIRFAPSAMGPVSTSLSFGYTNPLSGAQLTYSPSLSGIGTIPIQIFSGGYTTCISTELGEGLCWGKNSSGQLGQNVQTSISLKPMEMTKIGFGSGASVQKFAVGNSHVCALVSNSTRSGMVTCWGSNDGGRLGLGSATASLSRPLLSSTGALLPVDLGTTTASLPEEATDIAAGFEHTCAVLKSGTVKCWGGNTSGQLGNGGSGSIGLLATDMGNSLRAVALSGSSAVSVSAGAGHTCVTMSNGTSKCWGNNFYGQLGQGVGTENIGSAPSDLASLNTIALGSGATTTSVLSSQGAFTCALLGSGKIKCFGKTVYNETSTSPFFGVLGACFARPAYNAAASACLTQPAWTPSTAYGYFGADMGDSLPSINLGSALVSKIVVGNQHVCALTDAPSVKCWGVGERGQLGNGSSANVGAAPGEMGNSLVPAVSASGTDVPVSIAAGAEHTCAVFSSNTVKCWGGSTENATGLAGFGISSDTGISPNIPASLPILYDGRL